MGVADFTGDGLPDVVIGEHRGDQENRVLLFANPGGGTDWPMQVIDSGPKNEIDHHDGTQPADLDGDGDLDLVSIGWYNPKLWIFENQQQ
ncbi:MAG: FG-GAP-like repeat-containing protein [Phycisphaeraceae bacterium]